MTTDQEMQQLADQATQGPWEAWDQRDVQPGDSLEPWWSVSNDSYHNPQADNPAFNAQIECGTLPDAEFIAACREWVPDALRRLQAVRELHQPEPAGCGCSTCSSDPRCSHCSQMAAWDTSYPCPTIRAMENQ